MLFECIINAVASDTRVGPSLENRSDKATLDTTPKTFCPSKDIRVLVAEDNDINQLVVGEVLSMAGYAWDVVNSGNTAIEAARERRYDVILMDCQMPEMD